MLTVYYTIKIVKYKVNSKKISVRRHSLRPCSGQALCVLRAVDSHFHEPQINVVLPREIMALSFSRGERRKNNQ